MLPGRNGNIFTPHIHHTNQILTPKLLSHITTQLRAGLLLFFVLTLQRIKGDCLVCSQGIDICASCAGIQEAGMCHSGAVIDDLVEGFVFIWGGGVEDIEEAVCRGREEEGGM
jgi:hypothetical protein